MKNLEKSILDTVTDEDTGLSVEVKEGERVPTQTDPDWSEYVLSQLTEKEKDNNYPKTAGLFRFLKQRYDIIKNKGRLVCIPSFENMQTSIIEHELIVREFGGDIEEYQSLGEASPDQLPEPFNKYPAATAATRALGRAVKMALGLYNVTTVEEMIKSDSTDKIATSQVNGIYTLCKRLGVDTLKIINHDCGKMIFKTVEELDNEQGRSCMKLLNQLQQNPKLVEDYK